jgi:hypothetical protein
MELKVGGEGAKKNTSVGIGVLENIPYNLNE